MIGSRFQKNSWSDFESGGDVNPMESVSNLADVMLVLAVGIMMALIIAWDVDVVNTSPDMNSVSVEDTVELTEEYENLGEGEEESEESLDEFGLTEYGKVYKDEDGNLYLLGE